MLGATNPRDSQRTGAPFRRLLLAMDWTLYRPGELARLKWEQIHWEQDVAILPDHKTKRTGKPKVIPLIPKMQRLLRWLQQNSTSEFCFLNSKGVPWTINAIDHRMNHVKDRSGPLPATKFVGSCRCSWLVLGYRSRSYYVTRPAIVRGI
ncbi:MAG: hypothetical protein CMJ64_02155 [Planctomycetaceae bacterium]|nr:hypothetical protein [Planctomycetaceae bacterium]